MMMTWVEETTKSCSFSALKKHFHKSASHLPILSFGAFVVFNNCCDIDMYIFGISRGSVASNGPHRGVEIYCFTVFLDPFSLLIIESDSGAVLEVVKFVYLHPASLCLGFVLRVGGGSGDGATCQS